GVALWATLPIERRAACILDLASLDDPDCRSLLDRYQAAGIVVRVWNVTTDIGIAAFLCDIRDPAPGDPARLRRFHGSGCHADRNIGLARALTEAAQTRLTHIAGIRDDLSPAAYQQTPADEIGDALLDALAREAVPVAFDEVPTFVSDDLTADLHLAQGRLAAAGLVRA